MGGSLNQIRFPTVLGLAVIILGIFSGVFLTIQNSNIISQAAPDQTPLDIRVTNTEPESATISWKTNSAVVGFITYGQSNSNENVILDDRDKGNPTSRSLHYITIKTLTPNTTYRYKIISGKIDNLPEASFTTSMQSQTQNDLKPIIGNVLDNDHVLEEGIVYMELEGATPQSALVKNFGGFIIPINSISTSDLTEIYDPSGQPAQISVVTRGDKTTVANLTIASDNQLTQPIKIGESQNLDSKPEENALGISTFSQLLQPKVNKFDLNSDGKVNSLDYAYLLRNFGRSPKDKKADLNNDGVVNKKDQDLMTSEINKVVNQ